MPPEVGARTLRVVQSCSDREEWKTRAPALAPLHTCSLTLVLQINASLSQPGLTPRNVCAIQCCVFTVNLEIIDESDTSQRDWRSGKREPRWGFTRSMINEVKEVSVTAAWGRHRYDVSYPISTAAAAAAPVGVCFRWVVGLPFSLLSDGATQSVFQRDVCVRPHHSPSSESRCCVLLLLSAHTHRPEL